MDQSDIKYIAPDFAAILNARGELHQLLGQVIMIISAVPRYRLHPIADLTAMVIDPLLRGRLSTATPQSSQERASAPGGLNGLVIWATVSDAVDTKIRTQIEADVFPIRLIGDEWNSGQHFWILDVIAPTPQLAKTILVQFRASMAATLVSLHPHMTRLFDNDFLATLALLHTEAPDTKRVLN